MLQQWQDINWICHGIAKLMGFGQRGDMKGGLTGLWLASGSTRLHWLASDSFKQVFSTTRMGDWQWQTCLSLKRLLAALSGLIADVQMWLSTPQWNNASSVSKGMVETAVVLVGRLIIIICKWKTFIIILISTTQRTWTSKHKWQKQAQFPCSMECPEWLKHLLWVELWLVCPCEWIGKRWLEPWLEASATWALWEEEHQGSVQWATRHVS